MEMRDRLIELLNRLFDYHITDPYEVPDVNDFADDLLANGVIVPPCKAGDYAWVVFTPKHPANSNHKGKWFMVQDGVQRIIYGTKGLSVETWNMGTIPAKKVGKKLFFTQEEAEAELRKRSNDNAQNN